MTDARDDIRDLLGLVEGDGLSEVHSDTAPASPVGFGLSRAAANEDLAARIRVRPDLSTIAIPAIEPIARVDRWNVEPGVYVVSEAGGALRVLDGVVEPLDDETQAVVLDARRARAVVELENDRERFVVVCEGSRVSVLQVVAGGATSRLAEALEQLDLGTPITVEVPDLDALRGPYDVEPWLRSAFLALAESPSPVDRLAAVGLFVRLWSPATGERARVLAAIERGPIEPVQKPLEWVRSRTVDWNGVEGMTLERVQDWRRDLAALVTSSSAPDERRSAALLALVLERDDLASVEHALALAGHGRALTGALRRLDADAAVYGTMFDDLAGDARFDLERLHAVWSREPDAWWGALAWR